ncbi:retrotransposon protein, putative, ty1-copia subclass [Tanacetum coccineum]
MQSMKDNQVGDLVDLPPNDKIVGSNWLFKKKTDMDSNVHTYKAHLVAKSFAQTYGVDYEETFSPVTDIRSIKVYMVQPEGFIDPEYPNQFDYEIKKFGFTKNRDEPYVYMKASGINVTLLILYVDDILMMENHIPMLQDVKSYIKKCFAMKDLRKATYVLGIKIYRDRSRRLIGLCQSAYIENILKRFNMENSKRGSIPMQDKPKLSITQDVDDSKSQTRYVFVLNGGDVDWKSTTQSILATLSTKAEYIAAFVASK